MGLTSDQITNLNNSMSAAQDIALGTVIDSLMDTSGSLTSIVSGNLTPTAGSQAVATGLTAVTNVVVSFAAAPTINHMWVTAASSTGGNIIISSYAPTNASTVTPIAASGSFVKVHWVALGSM